MSRLVIVLALLAAGIFAASGSAGAADNAVTVVKPRAAVTVVEPAVADEAKVVMKPRKPEPRIAYGCKRVWRCDAEVCEWRRGCWGVYGYMEGPYYTDQIAKGQWARDGWPAPGRALAR